MKAILLFFVAVLSVVPAYACPVCEKQQPRLLQGISHGAGPQGAWDYVLVWATVIMVLLTLFYTAKWLIKPGEESGDHIKRAFLN
jgi:hypothetical protein